MTKMDYMFLVVLALVIYGGFEFMSMVAEFTK